VSLGTLRNLARPPGRPGAGGGAGGKDRAAGEGRAGTDRCDLCGAAAGGRHGHVVGLDQRSLLCACRACYLLFLAGGAGRGRYRSVPARYLSDPGRPITAAEWDELGIPVTTAYLFVNSDLGRVVACYPSPAGATECLLDLAPWDRLRRTRPLLAAPVDDVEAVYVTSTGTPAPGRPEAFLVPIDACFRLTGEVRLCWRGLDGGDEVRRVLARFADDLRARSRPIGAGGAEET
jgi:hypothetical protein